MQISKGTIFPVFDIIAPYMLNRVQIKLIGIFVFLIFIFISGIIYLKNSEIQRVDLLLQDKEHERGEFFDKIIKLKGESLQAFANDYTFFDEMVRFVKAGDKKWAKENINTGMVTFHATNAWVYRADLSPVYSVNTINADDIKDIPIPRTAFKKLFEKSNFPHFFINTHRGLIEIVGATIHPTHDYKRKTPPQGYFFIGRLWSKDYIDEIAGLTESTIRIIPAKDNLPESRANSEKDIISFSRILKAWDGSPLMSIYVKNEFGIIKELNRLSNRQTILLIIFASTTFILVFIFLKRWVSTPLSLISKSLTNENPSFISNLQKDKTEFGLLSKLILKFFEQRAELIKEMRERKKMEKEIIKAKKLESINILARGVAHDFNNKLTAILGNISLAKNHLNPEDKSYELLTRAENSVIQASELTYKLSTYAKSSTPAKRTTSIVGLIKDAVNNSLSGSNVVCEYSIPDDLWQIEVDEIQMDQVFRSLTSNTVEAMPDGGKMKITAENILVDDKKQLPLKPGKYIKISVVDHGAGIPGENLQKIFDPYFTTKRLNDQHGVGFGLAVCHSVIQHHRGCLTVESEVGIGTTFHIYLPVT